MRRTIACGLAAGLVTLVACQQSGGCGGNYDYPRTDPEGLPTPRALRLRMTQHGLDSVAAAFPSLMANACAGNPTDGSAACAPDPVDPHRLRFYLGTTAAPLDYDLVLSQGQVRPGSFIDLDDHSLRGNVHLSLVDVIGSRDGIQFTLGCDAANVSNCTDEAQYVNASLDMVVYTSGLLGWGESACFVQDELPPSPGLVIQSLRFTVYPHIQLGTDGKPYLVVNDSDVVVQRWQVSMATQTGKACGDVLDPQTGAKTCGDTCTDCGLCTTGSLLVDYIVEPLINSGPVAGYLATVIARQALRSFAKNALELVGAVDVRQMLSFANPTAEATGYLFDANVDTPEVSGTSGAAGMNVDFDTGFIARHSPCVPVVVPPSWFLPLMPDPGATIQAPDPTTGVLRDEAFDLALLVGDVVPGRALFELFDGGGFCFTLDAETIQSLSQGQFTPTVGGLRVVAPGLATLAPTDAPVTLVLVPEFPPLVSFGTGEGEGDARDSHLKLVWPGLTIDLMPLVDDALLRALAITCDLGVGLSFVPTPHGDLQVMVDRITLDNLIASYNEVPVQFDGQGLGGVIGQLVSTLITGRSFDVNLTAAMLGFPFVPKIRSVTSLGDSSRFLSVFVRFCTSDDLVDPANALCHETPPGSGTAPRPGHLGVTPVSGPGGPAGGGAVRVRAISDLAASADLELAYRVDGVGAYFSFRGADADGLFTLAHPALSVPGWHSLEVLARARPRPGIWSEPTTIDILADLSPPTLTVARGGGEVSIAVVDDFTPESRIVVEARIRGVAGDRGVRVMGSTSLVLADDESITLEATDDAGNVSAPAILLASSTATPRVTAAALPDGGGCTASSPSILAVLGCLSILCRRRTRQSVLHRR